MTTVNYKIQQSDDGNRLDVILASRPEIASRSFAQQLFDKGLVNIDKRPVSKSHKAKAGQTLTFQIPDPQEAEVEPQDIPLDIVYEDKDLAVINKPPGLVVHPSYGHWEGTLVNALLFHLKDLSAIGGVKRPGIVHRLDKDTSGLMLVAKNDQSHVVLSQAIKERRILRKYVALVEGVTKESRFSVEAPIARSPINRKKMAVMVNGRKAKTKAKVIKYFKEYTLLKIGLVTGRTHQIRVHMAYINHPIVGDEIYGHLSSGKPLNLKRPFLHAYRLSFFHPKSGQEMEFQADLPGDLKKALEGIGG